MKLKKIVIISVGVFAGALFGYLYWTYMGYDERNPFISSVVTSTLYSSVSGGILTGILVSREQIEL